MAVANGRFASSLRRLVADRVSLKALSGSLGLKVANAALSLLVSISLARALGPDDYGHYAFAMSVVALAMVPVHLGIPGLMVREIARGVQSAQWSNVRGAIRSGGIAVGVLSVITGAVLCLVFNVVLSESGQRASSLTWALLLIPVMALNQVRQAVLQGFKRVVAGQVPELVIVPVAMVLLVQLRHGQATSATTAIQFQLLATAIALLAGVFLFRAAGPAQLRDSAPTYQLRTWGRALLPFSLIAGLGAVKGQADMFVLGLLLEPSQPGLYRVALSAAGLVVFVQSAFNTSLAPRLAALHAAGSLREMERLSRFSSRLVVAFGVPVAIVLMLGGRWMIGLLYGAQYEDAALLVTILCVGKVFNGAVGSVTLILNMSGLERLTLRANVVMAFVGLALVAAVVPIWGVVGAAVASSATNALWSFGLLFLVKRHVKINPSVF